jgi:uncharacterized phage protein (TIGR01671 family)
MKREILFRVWDIVEKCYLPEDVYCLLNRTEFRAFGQMIKDWRDYKEGEYFYDDSQTLEQFTGLTDKNGVKIFEGDVFKLGVEKEVFEVRFEHGCYMAFCNGKQYGLIGELQMCFINIIGNIHDNPELINK